ncbi:putative remorin [Helianthus debilis subsp. tardiflorus]
MQQFTFQDHNFNITTSQSRSSYGGAAARDASPDSVIFSNFSLLSSSASASVDRCSSASDVVDRDSLISAMSLHLSGRAFRDFSTSRGPDLDPNNDSTVHSRKVEKAKSIIDGENNQTLDSARSSFSQAVKDCQNRKSRSEILRKKSDRRRPPSLDLNNQLPNMTSSSPRLPMKSSVSNRQTGMFPSPVTPKYSPANSGIQKGWSSERVPLHTNTNRRQVSSVLTSYNSGKTLPSKWEDAERWICSPVAGDGAFRPSVKQPQRRPKAKSGPLWPRRSAYNNSTYSPTVHMFDGGSVNLGSLFPGSPFSSGVNAGDGLSVRYHNQLDNSGNFPSLNEPCLARSLSLHGCSESLSESLLRITQDGRTGCVTDAATNIYRDVSRRDMATQMSPGGSPYSSPRRRNSNSISMSTSILPVEETRSPKADMRDVQVDDQFGLSRWSMKTRSQIPARQSASEMMDGWKRKSLEARSADWDVSEMAKNLSKVKREEAKITAWENLQKAKAEAAIRKLEMKLEKKRSSSMDKIMNKLRSNQKKAQEMRGSVLSKQTHDQVSPRSSSSSSSHKVISLIRTPQIGSISGCFTCHAF